MILPLLIPVAALAGCLLVRRGFASPPGVWRKKPRASLFFAPLVALVGMAGFAQPALAISAACSSINAGVLGFTEAIGPATLSGTYRVSPDGKTWSNNGSDNTQTFTPGEVITYTVSSVSSPSPNIHILRYDQDSYLQSGSVRNMQGSGSGTITIGAATDYINIATTDYEIDAIGEASPISDPAKQGTSAVITISCAAAPTPPVISAITPTSGGTAGGQMVTITGTNFDPTAAQNTVKFGASNATVTAATATQLTVTTPPGSVGAVDVSIETADGTFSLTSGYIYVAPPVAGTAFVTVASKSSNNPIPLSFSSGDPSSVAIATQASHGTAVASGTSITYTPTTSYAGPDSFTYTATNAAGTSAPATIGITVSNPTLTLSPAAGALPGATVASAYSQTMTASGGTAPYIYSVSTGSLPAGLSLNSNGTISGTPTAGGTFNFTVTATDSSTGTGPFTKSQSYSLTVATPTIAISPVFLPNATYGASYSQTVTASGGTGAYTYAVTAGSLPPGLSLSSSGVLSGTPTGAGMSNFTITVTDSSTGTGPYTTSIAYSLTTINTPPVAGASAVTVAMNSVNNPLALNLTGGVATAVTIGTATSHGTLVVSGASVTYTPVTGYAGPDSFTYTAVNSAGTSAPATVTLNVSPPFLTLLPAAGPLTNATVASPYSLTLTASGGTGPYIYTITAGSLPAGLSLNAATGVLSGTPTAGGTFNFTATSMDSSTGTGPFTMSRAYSLTVGIPVITISPTSLPDATLAAAYSQTITASGGTSAYTYAVTAGSLPSGLTLSSAGVISGTPTATGTFNATITATDSSTGVGPFTGSRGYTLTVNDTPPVANDGSATVASGSANNTLTLNITGGTPSTLSIASGPSHGSLSVFSTTSVSYTPDAGYAGTDTFTYTVDNNAGTSSLATFTITVSPPTVTLSPASGALPGASIASAYSQPLAASGGTGPYTYTVTAGALPAGLVLSSGGAISGTPTAGGTFNFTVTATDSSTGTGPFATSQAYSLIVAPPTIAVSPSALPGSTVATAYSEAITASGGTGPYTYAISAGALPSGITLSSTGVVSGTPTADGTFNFTIVATDNSSGAGPYTGSQAYSLTINNAAPVAGAVSASVAANSANNPVTLAISGGSATTVSIGTPPSHGTAAVSGLSITYTPTAGYAGPDTFTYTAGNGIGTSAPAAVAITVSAPTVTLAPGSGALADASLGTAYSQTLSASGGTAPYSYAVSAGSLPAGLNLASNGILSGTPTATGTYTFTVRATDSSTGTGPFTAMQSYTLAVGELPPVTHAVTATVAANASATVIPLNITGGAAASVAIASTPAHGTATVSGLSITYTPAAGYSGSDSFTYTATNAGGTSSAATATITVTAPTLAFSPSAGALTDGAHGVAYSQSFSASGGAAPYSYAIGSGSLPTGLALDAATGRISGTPTAAGTFNFTVAATDAHGATGSAGYSIVISAPATTFVFSPAGGSLSEAMAGEAYRQQITADGGTGSLLYRVTGGALPAGMVLNISTGELTGPSDEGSAGAYSFTVTVEDSTGATGSASFNLTVVPRTVTVANKVVDVPAGSTPPDVYLNGDATGGPFTSADLISVEPPEAGTAKIIRGKVAQAGPVVEPIGWYLQFSPNPAFSGTATVGYRLTSSLGTSNTGTVTYRLAFDADEVADDIDTLVHHFIDTRQNLIASGIYVPGLRERRKMGQGQDPVTARMIPTEEGMTASFSTSLAQMEAADSGPEDFQEAAFSPFNIWLDGTFLAHNRDDNGGKWGSFAMLNLGADYLLSERALVGLSFHYDRMTDPSDEDAELTGNGWLAGPYASFELGKDVFWDTSLLYGGSANDIDTNLWDGNFDTTRWMIDTALKGQWRLDDTTTFTPKLRVVYFSEEVDDYTVRNGGGDEIEIEGFDEEQFRVSLGAEIARSFTLDSGSTLTPKLGVTAGFAGMDGSGAYGSLTAGLALETADFWMLEASLLLDIEGDGEKAAGGKVRAGKQF